MVKNFEDMFIRFDMMHERDGHTDTDTHRMTASPRPRLRIASRGKKNGSPKNDGVVKKV